MSIPKVFIIETLNIREEGNKREGEVLSQILKCWGKTPVYFYIRTKKELIAVLKQFKHSRYRYLHFSCHANRSAVYTTLDKIPIRELAKIMGPYLNRRRLFISACSAANKTLAYYLFDRSGCVSLAGPAEVIGFQSAAMLWASFYHLVFKQDGKTMKGKDVLKILRGLSDLHRIPINYFTKDEKLPAGYKHFKIAPGNLLPQI
jgi:hypothetical protein